MRKNQKSNIDPANAEKAFNRALRYLNIRIRSSKEIADYLKRKGYLDNVVEEVISKLKNLKFLDDAQFSQLWIEERQKIKNKSRYFLTYELMKKGINEDLIKEKLEDAKEDVEVAKEFIERKKRIFSSLDEKEFKEKMIRLLSSRGFSWEIIRKALDAKD